MKKLIFVMFGLFLSLSNVFAAATPYTTLKYAKGEIKVDIIAPTTIIAGRNNFEFQFVDAKGTAITPVEIKDITGTSKMTSMQMGEDKILFKKGTAANSLIGIIRFSMSSMQTNDFLVTIVYKGETQTFTATAK